ncbi:MAG: hypothetical protein R3F65_32140 [bacterium]
MTIETDHPVGRGGARRDAGVSAAAASMVTPLRQQIVKAAEHRGFHRSAVPLLEVGYRGVAGRRQLAAASGEGSVYDHPTLYHDGRRGHHAP